LANAFESQLAGGVSLVTQVTQDASAAQALASSQQWVSKHVWHAAFEEVKPQPVEMLHSVTQLFVKHCSQAFNALLELQEAGGFGVEMQFTQAGSLAQACSWLQHFASEQSPQVAFCRSNPH
jgi:hypothetical protein